MCIIIVNKENVKVDDDIIKDSLVANPDGVGIYFLADKMVRRYYPIGEKKVLNLLRNKAYIAHFRYTSMGNTSKMNIHPFSIARRYYLFHNGTVPICDKKNKGFSDTKILSRIFSVFVENGIDIMSESFKKMIELADDRNKFVIYDTKTGDVQIINESKGFWINKVWFSRDPRNQVKKVYTSHDYGYGSSSFLGGGCGTSNADIINKDVAKTAADKNNHDFLNLV